jgi:hypothetical protein
MFKSRCNLHRPSIKIIFRKLSKLGWEGARALSPPPSRLVRHWWPFNKTLGYVTKIGQNTRDMINKCIMKNKEHFHQEQSGARMPKPSTAHTMLLQCPLLLHCTKTRWKQRTTISNRIELMSSPPACRTHVHIYTTPCALLPLLLVNDLTWRRCVWCTRLEMLIKLCLNLSCGIKLTT